VSSNFNVDEKEMVERLEFLRLGDEQRADLRELRPLFMEKREEFLDAFYGHLLKFDKLCAVLKDESTIRRARQGQAEYFERMLDGNWDEAFFELSIQVGKKHQEIGLEPKWVVASWNLYLDYWTREIGAYFKDTPEKALRCIDSLHKLTLLATSLSVESYYSKTMNRMQEVVASQRLAILELSTPVIQIWGGILVLPLIGTIDSVRTRQIMESLLERVVETQAEVVILDLTGVSVVDTAVANHLMKTVEAAELLGTHCILTGISPAIAQTLVHLGVDLGHISRCSSLKTGLKKALKRLGLAVRKAKG